MPWIYLLIAAAFEILFASTLKASAGFTRLWPTVATVTGLVGGIFFLGLAMKKMPVSVAYPIWTAIGTVGTVAVGFWLFGERMTLLKGVSIAFIILGVGGLKAGSGAAPDAAAPALAEGE